MHRSKRGSPSGSTPAKRPRTLSAEGATPHRVAAIRSQAKAKGLATPSPARANAAFSMLQLTTSSKRQESTRCTRSLTYEPQSLDEVARRLTGLLGEGGETVLDAEELERKYGFEPSSLEEALAVLGALGVVVKDEVSGFAVWNGTSRLARSVQEAAAREVVSTSTSKVHLTRRMVAVLAKTRGRWTVRELSQRLQGGENDLTRDVLEITGCLCALGLVEDLSGGAQRKPADVDGTYYRWLPPHALDAEGASVSASPSEGLDAAAAAGSEEQRRCLPASRKQLERSPSGSKRTAAASRLVTPVESLNKPTARPTPQSADHFRAGRRQRIVPRTDKSFNRRVLDDEDDEATPTMTTAAAVAAGSSMPARRLRAASDGGKPLPIPPLLLSRSPSVQEKGCQTDDATALEEADEERKGERSGESGKAAAPVFAKLRTRSGPTGLRRRVIGHYVVQGSDKSGSRVDAASEPSYLSQPLPKPGDGEPASGAAVTRALLDGKGDELMALPRPEDMLKYQMACLREFMDRYTEFYESKGGKAKAGVVWPLLRSKARSQPTPSLRRTSSIRPSSPREPLRVSSINSLALEGDSEHAFAASRAISPRRASSIRSDVTRALSTRTDLARSDTMASFSLLGLLANSGGGEGIAEGMEDSENQPPPVTAQPQAASGTGGKATLGRGFSLSDL